ncbi:hypothetical protein JCM17960_30080 [Magnetospira thiophila]
MQRYSAETLTARLGDGFYLVEGLEEVHHTPKGGSQRFSYALVRVGG